MSDLHDGPEDDAQPDYRIVALDQATRCAYPDGEPEKTVARAEAYYAFLTKDRRQAELEPMVHALADARKCLEYIQDKHPEVTGNFGRVTVIKAIKALNIEAAP